MALSRGAACIGGWWSRVLGALALGSTSAAALAQGVTYTDIAFEAGLRTPHNPAPNFLLSGLNLANLTAGGAVTRRAGRLNKAGPACAGPA